METSTKRSNHQSLTAADFLYTNDRRFFALLGEGMEEWAASELEELGAEEIQAGERCLCFSPVSMNRPFAALVERFLQAPLYSTRKR